MDFANSGLDVVFGSRFTIYVGSSFPLMVLLPFRGQENGPFWDYFGLKTTIFHPVFRLSKNDPYVTVAPFDPSGRRRILEILI